MSARGRHWLWFVLGLGAVVRLVWALFPGDQGFDLQSESLVNVALAHHSLHAYSALHEGFLVGGVRAYRWPYPSAFFVWIEIAGWLATHTAVAFHTWVKLPAVLADCAVAWLVQDFLGRRGVSDRARVAAAALIALGPLIVADSAYHSQIDSIAILPAVVAVYGWDRFDPRWRAVACGGLIGIGAAIKWVPLAMVLPLLVSVRSRKEAGMLVGAAVAVPIAALLPFAAVDPHGVAKIFGYKGAPGLGGLGLVVQPGLAADWLHNAPLALNAGSRLLYAHGSGLPVAGILLLAAVLWRLRPPPEQGATLVWLVFYVFSANFFMGYFVWGIPFFLMAGHLRRVLQLEAALLIPLLLSYFLRWGGSLAPAVYATMMIGVWLGLVVALVRSVLAAKVAGKTARLAVA